MIVKIQISLDSSDDVRRMLIYNKDRSFLSETELDPDVEALVQGRSKTFFDATIVNSTHDSAQLVLIAEVPDPGW